MAITYVAGNRAIGTNAERLAFPLYYTDFSSSTGWTLDNAVITNNQLQASQNGNNVNRTSYYNLGSAVSTSFVLRFKIDTNNYTNNSSGQGISFQIGLSNSSNPSGFYPSSGFLAVSVSVHAATNESNFYILSAGSASAGTTRGEPLNVIRYIELSSNGSTLTAKIYTTSDYSGSPEETITKSYTVPTDLRYLLVRVANEAVAYVNTLYYDDIKLWSGVTTAGNTIYPIQNGLEFHETDTNKDYVFNSSNNTWYQIT